MSDVGNVYENTEEKLNKIISLYPVVLFIKGTLSFPLCGLSSDVCYILKRMNIPFKCIDALRDPELHYHLRDTNRPAAMPYLYINSAFVGGYEEILEKHESMELIKMCSNYPRPDNLYVST